MALTHTYNLSVLAYYRGDASNQFKPNLVLRELNKAYCAFKIPSASNSKRPVATGNWGCGAFNGDPELKFIIQLLAASEAERPIHMFTFGDKNQSEQIELLMTRLNQERATCGALYNILLKYHDEEIAPFRHRKSAKGTLFSYIRSNISKMSSSKGQANPSSKGWKCGV